MSETPASQAATTYQTRNAHRPLNLRNSQKYIFSNIQAFKPPVNATTKNQKHNFIKRKRQLKNYTKFPL